MLICVIGHLHRPGFVFKPSLTQTQKHSRMFQMLRAVQSTPRWKMSVWGMHYPQGHVHPESLLRLAVWRACHPVTGLLRGSVSHRQGRDPGVGRARAHRTPVLPQTLGWPF